MCRVKVHAIYVTMIQLFVKLVYQPLQHQFIINLDVLLPVHALWVILSISKTVHVMLAPVNAHHVLRSVFVLHAIPTLLFIKIIVSPPVQIPLTSHKEYAYPVQDVSHAM